MKISQLAVELDGVLVDIEAHQVAMAKLYYGDTYMKDEYSEIPYVVPGFFEAAPPMGGSLGALRRIYELNPNLYVHVVSDRPDRFRMESQRWVENWMVGWKMPPTHLSITSDFRLVPAQLYVCAPRHDEQLSGLKTVRTLTELVGGTQDTLDFEGGGVAPISSTATVTEPSLSVGPPAE